MAGTKMKMVGFGLGISRNILVSKLTRGCFFGLNRYGKKEFGDI
jgi:hypothetical protein